MSYLRNHHVSVADPAGAGHNAVCVGFLMHATRGQTFPWRDGGVVLLRRELYPDMHEWQPCGIAVDGETEITNYPGMTHLADQGYQYAIAQFGGNGMISAIRDPIRLDFDGAGDLIQPPLPMFPVHATAEAIAGGKFKVRWEYEPRGQGGYPTDFQVFEGADAASVDYNTPLTDSVTGLSTVGYVGERRIYAFTTGAYTDRTEHVFAVRARNAGGVAEKNTYVAVVKKARAVLPSVAPAPSRGIVVDFGGGKGGR